MSTPRAHARYAAARAEPLRAVAGLLEGDAWQGDGAGNLPSWLAARWQISVRTARALVRDAEALKARPALDAALASGAISVDQSKALRAHGGSNDVSNLQLVCWQHHKLIHEGGCSIRGKAGRHATWIRPDGSPFEPRVRVALDTS